MAIRKKKSERTIKIHEKILATKHYFPWALYLLIDLFILFIVFLVNYIVFKRTNYHDDRGISVVISVVVGILLLALVTTLFYLDRTTPRWLISYDTKYRFFKVYKNRSYHIVRCNNIKKIKSRVLVRLFGEKDGKKFGKIEIQSLEYVTGKPKQVLRKYKLFVPEPETVKELMYKGIDIYKKYMAEEDARRKLLENKQAAKQALIDRANREQEEKKSWKDEPSFMDRAVKRGQVEDIKEDISDVETIEDAIEAVDKIKEKYSKK